MFVVECFEAFLCIVFQERAYIITVKGCHLFVDSLLELKLLSCNWRWHSTSTFGSGQTVTQNLLTTTCPLCIWHIMRATFDTFVATRIENGVSDRILSFVE